MHELTVRRENALSHRAFDFGGHFDRLFKRIHHRKQVLGKLLDAELLRLGNVFGSTATHVFHFGNRTHVKIKILSRFGRRRGKLVFERGFCAFGFDAEFRRQFRTLRLFRSFGCFLQFVGRINLFLLGVFLSHKDVLAKRMLERWLLYGDWVCSFQAIGGIKFS